MIDIWGKGRENFYHIHNCLQEIVDRQYSGRYTSAFLGRNKVYSGYLIRLEKKRDDSEYVDVGRSPTNNDEAGSRV